MTERILDPDGINVDSDNPKLDRPVDGDPIPIEQDKDGDTVPSPDENPSNDSNPEKIPNKDKEPLPDDVESREEPYMPIPPVV